ncbi:5156_t:CDS:2, partial [Gigaspora margarita]
IVDIKLKEEQINIEWDHLSNMIQKAANKHKLWSKAKKTDFNYKKVIPKHKYHKELKLLYKICKYKKEKGKAKISYSEHTNLLRKKAEVLARNIKKKEIQSRVKLKFGIMNRDKKRILLSLLNKLANKIKIDKVLKEEETFYQNSKLVIEEKKVKEYIVKYFEKQFRERKHRFEELSKK